MVRRYARAVPARFITQKPATGPQSGAVRKASQKPPAPMIAPSRLSSPCSVRAHTKMLPRLWPRMNCSFSSRLRWRSSRMLNTAPTPKEASPSSHDTSPSSRWFCCNCSTVFTSTSS